MSDRSRTTRSNIGLGYFVKKFSDYADYTNVIAGIVLMGIVVTIIDVLVKKLESSLIKWK